MIRPALLLIAAIVLGCHIGGCGPKQRRGDDGLQGNGTDGGSNTAVTVRDDLGRTLTFTKVPSRIVSLAPSITECLFALGAGRAVVGVTSYCNWPAEARSRTVVGDMLTPDIERIVALQPDLAILSIEGNRRDTFDALERLGIRCLVTQPRSLDDVLASLRMLGVVLGRSARATELTDSLAAIRRAVVAASASADAHPRILMLLSFDPLMAAGRGTFIDEMIRAAGGANAGTTGEGASARYPALGREDVLARNPDIVLLPTDMIASSHSLVERFPEWRNMNAVRRNQVHGVNADIFMRPGPRTFEALEVLARIIASWRGRHDAF